MPLILSKGFTAVADVCGKCLVSLLMVMLPAVCVAEIPMLNNSMNCVRSATILYCANSTSSYYSVAVRGNDTFARGYDVATDQSWVQTSTGFGRFQFFSGVSDKGVIWVGSNRRIGWTAVTRLSTSDGDQTRFVCNRLVGCN